ncbi:MAG: cation:proton antiporter [Candidatus Paracaedimonas acanthamoebae]|uniref:Cation:proton antiporter n=1 Tax=Candidatus Paracaedimonas acanthamoebae TaxID=244581 RepID=A0A8J7TV63_9PROT|nr:cation:proton antiporter [Candidatus Paracaedimonas acanthamoebae]
MEHALYLKETLILLISAVAVVSFFQWLKASSILGYLLAGLIIGPKALGFINTLEGTRFLGEMGVLFLLFTIGLKMPLQRLQVLRRYVFGLGLLQVTCTSALIIFVLLMFDVKLEPAILIGTVLALSSTAVGIQILSERGEMTLRFGRVSFAILLLQDLFVVVLLMLISAFKDDSSSLLSILGISFLKTTVVLFLIILLGRVLLKPVYRGIAQLESQELFVTMSLLVILIISAATAAAGLSLELGAFLAGILLSETEYRHQVEADIQPFYGLLIGLFFMTLGMSVDPYLILQNISFIFAGLLGLIAIKGSVILGLCRVFNIPFSTGIRVGLLLAGSGEFAFVVLSPAIEAKIISLDQGQLLFAIVAISMGLTPLLAMLGRYIDERWVEKETEQSIETQVSECEDVSNHVIICGFGRVGNMIARLLREQMVPFLIVDNNLSIVSQGRLDGYPIFYGDARRTQVLRALGATRARAIVICLNSRKGAVRIALTIRREFPNLQVLVRLRDDEYESKLTQAGIVVVRPETFEPSLQLATKVLEATGYMHEEAHRIINGFRKNYES